MTLSVATWNVNSIGARLPHLQQWLAQTAAPDVICLQEIKCVEAKYPAKAIEDLGYQSFIYGQPSYNGVAILVKKELAGQVNDLRIGFPSDDETSQRRLIALSLGEVKIVDVYIPNGQAVGSEKYAYKLDWLAKLRHFFDSTYQPEDKVLLCGDFNVAPADIDVHDPKEWEGEVLCSEAERAAMLAVQGWGFIDTFRQLYPDTQTFSWWDYRQAAFRRNMGLRIDHIWVTHSLFNFCEEIVIDIEPRKWERPSDHAPVIGKFSLP
jgi:exodeoxyribonuclease III